MRYRRHAYHRLLVLVFAVLLVRSSAGSGSGHSVVGRLWLESGRGKFTITPGICESGDWSADCVVG